MKSKKINRISAMQVIICGMGIGITLLGFVLLVLFPNEDRSKNSELAPVLFGALGIMAVGEIAVFVFMRGSAAHQLRSQIADLNPQEIPERLEGAYATLTIIGAAMTEGLGLFGVLIAFLTGKLVALAASVMALLILFLVLLPSKHKLHQFAVGVLGPSDAMRVLES